MIRPGLLSELPPSEPSDACCWGCSGGGDVACCDGCRAVYHLSCIGLEQLPEDDWFCPLCHCCECREACQGQEDPLFINTKLLPVIPKQLQPRVGPHQKFPAGPGYLCPHQARQWLQQPQDEQQGPATAAADTAQHGADGKTTDAAEEQQPKAKRQKQGEPRSSSGSVSPTGNSRSAAIYIRCCCCQQACHVNCLPPPLKQQYSGRAPLSSVMSPAATPVKQANGTPGKQGGTPRRQQSRGSLGSQKQQQQQPAAVPPALDPYFCCLACQQVATQLATRCAQGMVQVDALADGTPICFQVVQPAAVAAALTSSSPGALGVPAAAAGSQASVGLLGTGVAAGHSQAQAQVLAQVLRDALELLGGGLGPAWEVRSLDNVLPWLVGGLRQATPGGLLDLSPCHVALLWVGSTLASAAVMRLHGPNLLEVPMAATQQALQHKQLGALLMACIERLALETCKVKQAWLPALNDVARPCTGVSLLPTWDRPAEECQALQLTPSCSVKLLGLDRAAAAAAAVGAGGSSATSAEQERQRSQADAQSCWGHQLGYGAALSVADWMQLPKHMLLRYSYVPFLTKRLSPETLVPLPKFSTRPLAGPAAVAADPAAIVPAPDRATVAAAAGQAASSTWHPLTELLGPSVHELVAAAFPHQSHVMQQPVRRTSRQRKKLKRQEEQEDEEEEEDDEQQQDAEEEELREQQLLQRQQLQLQRNNRRQEFQEQVRQQFLARQKAYKQPAVQQQQRRRRQQQQQPEEHCAQDDGAAAAVVATDPVDAAAADAAETLMPGASAGAAAAAAGNEIEQE